jgi:DNA repair exonuclease SbcCD nuclease subunit
LETLKIQNSENVLLFSDIHFGKNRDADFRLTLNTQIIDWIISEFSTKTDTLLFLGDWYNNRNSLNINTQNIAYTCLKNLSKSFKNIIVLVGNHDIFHRENTNVNSLKPFSELPNVKIIEKLTKLEFKNGKDAYLFPWNSYTENLDPVSLAFGHLEFDGIIHGDSSGININDITQIAPLVFSGHYHIRQTIPTRNGQIEFIGSPCQLDFGDVGNSRGVHLLNTNNLTFKFIENEFSPRFINYNWSNILNKSEKINKKSVYNNFIRLTLDQKYDYELLVKVMEKINDLSPMKLTVDFKYTLSQFAADNPVTFKKSMNPIDYLHSYVDNMDDETLQNISKQEMKRFVSEYYQNAIFQDETALSNSVGNNQIEFISLDIQNFKSIGKRVSVDFSKHFGFNYICGINLDGDGSNGSGKSSIFIDSLLWILYNRTVYNCKNDNLPNRIINSSKKAKKKIPIYGALIFKKNNKFYRVENHLYKHLLFEIDENGDVLEDLTKSSVFETRTYLAKEILGLTYDIFRNSVILSGSSFKNIFELGKHHKREFIESIFNLSVFSTILVQCRKDSNSNDKEILSTNNLIKTFEFSINEYKLKFDTFMKNENERLELIKQKISKKHEDIKKLKLDHDDRLLKLKDKIQNLDEYQIKLNNLSVAKSKIDAQIKSNTESVEHRIGLKKKYQIVLDKICEDCFNTVSENLDIKNLEDYTQSKINTNQQLTEKRIKIIEASTKIEEAITKLKKIKIAFEKEDKDIQHNLFVKNHLEEDITHLTESLDIVNENPFDDLIKQKTTELELYQGSYNEKMKLKKKYSILEYLVGDDEHAVKAQIVTDIVDLLNGLIRKYLSILGGTNFSSYFSQTFDFEIVTSSGQSDYGSLSAGEKQKVNLATLMSFQEILQHLNSLSVNIQLFDEFDSGLDSSTLTKLLEFLSERSKNHPVFLISHKLKESDLEYFDNKIVVSKSGDFTTIISDPQVGIIESIKEEN